MRTARRARAGRRRRPAAAGASGRRARAARHGGTSSEARPIIKLEQRYVYIYNMDTTRARVAGGAAEARHTRLRNREPGRYLDSKHRQLEARLFRLLCGPWRGRRVRVVLLLLAAMLLDLLLLQMLLDGGGSRCVEA